MVVVITKWTYSWFPVFSYSSMKHFFLPVLHISLKSISYTSKTELCKPYLYLCIDLCIWSKIYIEHSGQATRSGAEQWKRFEYEVWILCPFEGPRLYWVSTLWDCVMCCGRSRNNNATWRSSLRPCFLQRYTAPSVKGHAGVLCNGIQTSNRMRLCKGFDLFHNKEVLFCGVFYFNEQCTRASLETIMKITQYENDLTTTTWDTV